MSGLVRVSPYDRTTAVPPRGDEWFPVGADQPTVWPSDDVLTTFVTGDSGIPVVDADGSVLATVVAADNCIYSRHSWLALRMLLDASLWQAPGSTTYSRPPLLIRRTPTKPLGMIPRAPASLTPAQEALAEIRSVSALTNEEIAPLAGVSRRSVQAWVAGESISARKEQRLRALLDAIRDLDASDPKRTRRRLFDHMRGNVSTYDLLAEGRFNEAVNLAADRRTATASPAQTQSQDLAAQLDHHEGHIELPPERLNRRFSGRLRR
jgi:hypothetical protein